MKGVPIVHLALERHGPAAGAGARGEGRLTAGERARLAALHVAKRRADWLSGRLAAKAAVAAALGEAHPGRWAPRALEIDRDAAGRPVARLAPEAPPTAGFRPGERLPVSVSISHAEGHALCAAAQVSAQGAGPELGIDLGRIEPRSDAFLDTFLTPAERRFVAAAPEERALRANVIWCAKEAVLKALGLGLSVDTLELSCLPVAGDADPARWPLAPSGLAPPGPWHPFVATCAPSLVRGGDTVHGIWRRFEGFVGTLAAHPGAPGRRALA